MRPRRDAASTRPAVTTRPVPSITGTPAGAAPVPTDAMRPFCTTTVAFLIVCPAAAITVAPRIANDFSVGASGVVAAVGALGPVVAKLVGPERHGEIDELPTSKSVGSMPAPRS